MLKHCSNTMIQETGVNKMNMRLHLQPCNICGPRVFFNDRRNIDYYGILSHSFMFSLTLKGKSQPVKSII